MLWSELHTASSVLLDAHPAEAMPRSKLGRLSAVVQLSLLLYSVDTYMCVGSVAMLSIAGV